MNLFQRALNKLKALEYYSRPFDNSETEDKKSEAIFMAIKALEADKGEVRDK